MLISNPSLRGKCHRSGRCCRGASRDRLQCWEVGGAGGGLGVLAQWGLRPSESRGQSARPHSPGVGRAAVSRTQAGRHRALLSETNARGLHPTPTERRPRAGLFRGEPSRGDGPWTANDTPPAPVPAPVPRPTRAPPQAQWGARSPRAAEVAPTPEAPADFPPPQPTRRPPGAQRGPLCMVGAQQSPSGVPGPPEADEAVPLGSRRAGQSCCPDGGPAPGISQAPVRAGELQGRRVTEAMVQRFLRAGASATPRKRRRWSRLSSGWLLRFPGGAPALQGPVAAGPAPACLAGHTVWQPRTRPGVWPAWPPDGRPQGWACVGGLPLRLGDSRGERVPRAP